LGSTAKSSKKKEHEGVTNGKKSPVKHIGSCVFMYNPYSYFNIAPVSSSSPSDGPLPTYSGTYGILYSY